MYLLPPHLKTSPEQESYVEGYKRILSAHRRTSATSASSILIAVAPDIDALCAAKMLEALLRQDNITHRLRPISGLTPLVAVKEELLNNPELSTLVLINIGSIIDIPGESWFGPVLDRLEVHIIDSSRPQNLSSLQEDGIYRRVIVWDDGGAERLEPERTAFRLASSNPELDSDSDSDLSDGDEDDDEDASEDEHEDRPRKRRRLNSGEPEESRGQPQFTREQREECGLRIEKHYTSGTWYAQASCSVVYVLATLLDRADNDLLWLTILGLTYQYLTNKIPRDAYEKWHTIYLDEVARLNPPSAVNGLHADDNSIRPSDELRFALFRHWNLYDAMYHSPYVASKLGIWKDRGRKRLQGLLAKMGFSIQQCQQSWAHMDMDLKRELRDKMESIAPEYGLVELGYPSFVRSFGFRTQPLCAADVVDGVSALLEAAGGIRLDVEVEGGRNGGEWFGTGRQWQMRRDDNKENIPVQKKTTGPKVAATQVEKAKNEEEWWKNNFWVAYDALSNDTELLQASLRLSMTLQRAVIRQGSSLIEKQEIKTLRTFRLGILKEGPELPIFSHPGNLSRLALWLIEALRDRVDLMSVGATKKKALPLVLACLNEKANTYLIVGVTGAPEFGDTRKNRFGFAFLEAQRRSNASTSHTTFDTSIVEVPKEDLQSFLSKLQLQ